MQPAGAAAGNPYFGYEKSQTATGRLWEEFNAGTLEFEAIGDPYTRALVDDWSRCRNLGIDVAMQAGRRLSESELETLLENSHDFLETARPVIDGVRNALIDVPGMLILTEDTGAIIYTAGDQSIRNLAAERSGIIEGSRWSQEVAGNNGIGSALKWRAPVHVYSSEHFCEGWHRWTCAAAPIVSPDRQQIAGVIDFTTIDADYRDQAVALTVSLANAINAHLRLRYELERGALLRRFQAYTQRYRSDDLILLDRYGRVVAQSEGDRALQLAQRLSQGGSTSDFAPLRSLDLESDDGESRIGTVVISSTGNPRVLQVKPRNGPLLLGEFATDDPATKASLHHIGDVAKRPTSVLIWGETGTGKELLARHLHTASGRAGRYVAVNCGAISRELMESSFFGYVRGAFSGADSRGRAGFFEAAKGGTLFLDEIGELPLDKQVTLLRVLEDGTYNKVGSDRTETADCRIVAATNRDLSEAVDQGTFRRDLFYRLGVVQLHVPPLRQRKADLPLLADLLSRRSADRLGRTVPRIGEDALEVICGYEWPGNARELRNAMEAALICCGETITVQDLPPYIFTTLVRDGHDGDRPAGADDAERCSEGSLDTGSPRAQLDAYERKIIISALRKYKKVNRAARALNMARSTLYRKFEQLEINQSDYL
jgi:sigma-54 dependent transcriptional regulator, acetoin dehydrogenase operon transcriptional activator AcoR